MANYTIAGNLTSDPTLSTTTSGLSVVNLTIAHTPRSFDKATNKWQDEPTLFIRTSLWGQEAENAAQSLTKGMPVLVSGDLRTRTYTTKEGVERSELNLVNTVLGVRLNRQTGTFTRNPQPSEQTDEWSQPAGSWGDEPF